MLTTLFQTITAPPPLPSNRSKRQRSREGDEASSRKRESIELAYARRASFIDEEAWQMRVHELVVVAFIFSIVDVERSTIESAYITRDTTDSLPTTEGASSLKPDPPSC